MNKKYLFKTDKLIRDKIPQFLKEKGVVSHERTMEQIEYLQRLDEKLIEEANEVIDSKTKSELQEELADLLEVIHSIADNNNITIEDIETVRLNKKLKKGGFETKTLSLFVEVSDDNEEIRYFLEKQEKYPKII